MPTSVAGSLRKGGVLVKSLHSSKKLESCIWGFPKIGDPNDPYYKKPQIRYPPNFVNSHIKVEGTKDPQH